MRLIDGTIQALPMSNYILERKETFIKVLENGDNDFLFAMLMEYFDKQPTAYDVEKVVEKLKEWSFETEIVISTSDGYEDTANREIICTLNAIDIVRKGGAE